MQKVRETEPGAREVRGVVPGEGEVRETEPAACEGDTCSLPNSSNPEPAVGRSVVIRYALWVAIAVTWVYFYFLVAKIHSLGPVFFLLGTLALVFVRAVVRGSSLKRSGGIEAVLSNGRPTVMEVYSDACLPCIAVKPLAAAVRAELRGKADYLALSMFTSAGMQAARAYGIVGTPTFIHFDASGNEVSRGFKPPTVAAVLGGLPEKK